MTQHEPDEIDAAREPRERRTAAGRQVRDDWVNADVIAPSDVTCWLSSTRRPLEQMRNIRRPRGSSRNLHDRRQGCRLPCWNASHFVASGSSAPPDWSEVIADMESYFAGPSLVSSAM